MFIIALTGGIACGKSTVAEYFKSLGIMVIDADEISRELVKPNTSALAEIIAHFGEQIKNEDGTLNRKKLKAIIFEQPNEKIWLENLLHPLILKEMFTRAQLAKSVYVVLDIPLLAEIDLMHYASMIHRIIVVTCNQKLQLQRLRQRDQLDEKFAKKILKAQSSEKARLALADDIIYNQDDIVALKRKVEQLHLDYVKMAEKLSSFPRG
jgi:dephospho-CoA kinase